MAGDFPLVKQLESTSGLTKTAGGVAASHQGSTRNGRECRGSVSSTDSVNSQQLQRVTSQKWEPSQAEKRMCTRVWILNIDAHKTPGILKIQNLPLAYDGPESCLRASQMTWMLMVQMPCFGVAKTYISRVLCY